MLNINGGSTLTLAGTIWAPGGKININLMTAFTGFIDSCTLNVNATVNGNGPSTSVPGASTESLVG